MEELTAEQRAKFEKIEETRLKRNLNARLYREKHPEKARAATQTWIEKNREKVRERERKRYSEKPEILREQGRRGRRKARQECIEAYGGKCTCCGESTLEFLTVEHTEGNGQAHRKEVGAGRMMYIDLKRRGWPKEGITIFCMNCNFATRFSQICPHQKKKEA